MHTEDEELIARLIQEDLSNTDFQQDYQEESFINYETPTKEDEMQKQMDQVLETASLLRWEYENNLMNHRIKEEEEREEEKKKQQLDLEDRRRVIEEQNREYEDAVNKDKPPEIPMRFICPISNKIMENPIYHEESNTHYEKIVLLKYLTDNNNKTPSGVLINKSKLVMDNPLKQEIFLWKREHCK